MIDHHIQREILGSLARADSMKFSELKPAGMESNIFMYHLNQLINKGYVLKQSRAYTLDFKGLQYADTLSLDNLKPRIQPKLLVILAIKNREGQWLMAWRKVQPYLGQFMLPSGKRHFGESRDNHAVRELQEKTGWTLPLEYRGTVEVLLLQGEQPLTHIVGELFTATQDAVQTPKDTNRFSYEWLSFDKLSGPMLAGTSEIIHALESNKTPISLSLRLNA